MKKKWVRLGSLPEAKDICGLILQIPKERQLDCGGYKELVIRSGWNKGLWLAQTASGDGRIYPLLFKSFNQIKNWKVRDAND